MSRRPQPTPLVQPVRHVAPSLTVSVTPGPCGTACVSARGEIDLHSASMLHTDLLIALTAYRGVIGVDLTAVDFCDCAGLNALLTARGAALSARRDLHVTGVSPQVRRLLQLTGTAALLICPPRPEASADREPGGGRP